MDREATSTHSFIFDIGKTNLKSIVFDQQGSIVWSISRKNSSSTDSQRYLHFDIDEIWHWLLQSLKQASASFQISAINISTHGACAVLLDKNGEQILPVMDYEYEGVETCTGQYREIRPSFDETYSPELPAGLNLGKQLSWLKQNFPDEFAQLDTLLFYPQYFVYKLTGIAVTEVTSLGCHTDLWEPASNQYSSLVDRLNIRNAFAPMVPAFEKVGQVNDDIMELTGMSGECSVYAGVHDSNASFTRYLASDTEKPFTVVSSGTWTISMLAGSSCNSLNEARDMLANVSVEAEPVPCARFMGGKDFETICRLTGADEHMPLLRSDLEQIIDDKVFALPSFSEGGGPFYGQAGKFTGEPKSGKALATLYLVMMIDLELDLLQSTGNIIFGSVGMKSPVLCQLLAQLRTEQQVYLSGDESSTALGAWCLTCWGQEKPEHFKHFELVESLNIQGLKDYHVAWRKHLDQINLNTETL